MRRRISPKRNRMENDISKLVALSEDMASAMRQLQLADVEDTTPEPPADEARQLLRWLDNLPSADLPLDEWLETGTAEEAVAKASSLSQLLKIFIRKLKRARWKRREIMREEIAVENATHAAAAMTQAVIDHTLSQLPKNHPQVAALETALASLPPQADMRQAQSVKRLIGTVSTGMDRVSGKNISGKSAPERLVETNAHMQATMRTLRSVHSMEPPAREESIELAREILRRLKNLKFNDKPIEEMIEAGQLEDKAIFAEQIDEMADMYKNLLQEAAEINPSILQDQRVKDANEAIATFTHSVKLMAAKEMPNSIASAQQISADATHNPEEWGKLQGHTVGRLLKSMEGGLEKAVGNLEAEQSQDQDQQQAQEAALEAAMHHADHARRKKRKRRGGGGKTATSAGKKQTRQAHTADAKVAKEAAFVHVVHGLTAEAMAAVKQAGGALFKVGNQAKDISATLAAVSSTDKIAPDDKTVSQRVIEEEIRKGPRNQGGPGV